MRTRLLIGALSLAAVVGAGAAFADRRCEARVSDWRPRSDVVRMAEEKGWQVERIRIDDGCYALRVVDAQGRGMRVLVDPTTLAVVATKMRDDDDHRRRWRGGDNEDGKGRRERRRERGRDHDDDDDDDDRRGPRSGGVPQPLGPIDGAAPPAPSGAAPIPPPPIAAPPMPGDGGLIGKPKSEIR
jgi:hypothetical protein